MCVRTRKPALRGGGAEDDLEFWCHTVPSEQRACPTSIVLNNKKVRNRDWEKFYFILFWAIRFYKYM